MSEQQPNQIAGAITYPASTSSNENVSQPRQPQNLQGLLRFAMEATKREDAPGESLLGPLDEERRRFLEEALKSLTVDVIEILLKAINVLKSASDLSLDSDLTEYLNAFDSIIEYVDRIDTAIDFYKIGGYDIFEPCLNCVHASIRANACNILAELCQNNPFCQDRALERDYIKTLINLVDTDIDPNVSVKALYALSCNIREHEASLDEFRKQQGLNVLLNALQKPVNKLRIKICFLLSALCSKNKDFQNEIIRMGFVQLFISILSEERTEIHEHVLAALTSLVKSNSTALEECQKPHYTLKALLRSHLRIVDKREEAIEEKEYCKELLSLFNTDTTSVER